MQNNVPQNPTHAKQSATPAPVAFGWDKTRLSDPWTTQATPAAGGSVTVGSRHGKASHARNRS